MMNYLAGLSFHEGNRAAARAMAVEKATAARSAMAKNFWLRMVFLIFSFQWVVGG
jgi:hypothetical protein